MTQSPASSPNAPHRHVSRRSALKTIAAGAVIVGFDPFARLWIPKAHAHAAPAQAHGGTHAANAPRSSFRPQLPDLDGTLYTDLATRQSVHTDVGNLKFVTPHAVLRPGSVRDIENMVKFCNKNNIQVAARGQGHTTFGHALSPGLVIEIGVFDAIHSIDASGAVVDGGVQWSDLMLETTQYGLTPPVLTGYTQLTIGGTLSVGGASGTYRRGLQIANVQWLDVVTGKGELVRCSEQHESKLFDAVLGGIGQFGIIVAAKVDLVSAPQFIRLSNLYYVDNAQFFGDLRKLIDREEVDDIYTAFIPQDTGFLYQLNVAIGFDAEEDPDTDFLLRDLSLAPSEATVTDLPYATYALRVDTVVDSYKQTSQWQDLTKPWFDVWLPASTIEQYTADVLPTLTPQDVGSTGFLLLLCSRRSLATRPFFAAPDPDTSDWFFLFDLLTSSEEPGPDVEFNQRMLARNRELFEKARALGGKRYVISSIEFSQADWAEHYGSNWNEFKRCKRRYDPNSILSPGLGIFEC
jgi:cytokinin dehydrogenase